jgi:hypothetical protein
MALSTRTAPHLSMILEAFDSARSDLSSRTSSLVTRRSKRGLVEWVVPLNGATYFHCSRSQKVLVGDSHDFESVLKYWHIASFSRLSTNFILIPKSTENCPQKLAALEACPTSCRKIPFDQTLCKIVWLRDYRTSSLFSLSQKQPKYWTCWTCSDALAPC